jgi:hypothetical protein
MLFKGNYKDIGMINQRGLSCILVSSFRKLTHWLQPIVSLSLEQACAVRSRGLSAMWSNSRTS